ncbi:MAG: hypothetical protein KKB30_04620 [Proteobacteria bacterium]|nr:hypothetical protein [Pseudomonadota bacterium]MBU1715507.1 hypothetical protein [Pseudomonadota bacterium]
MKLYAQQGYGEGEKIFQGLHEGIINGAILSPRDLKPDVAAAKIAKYKAANPEADLLIDPQFYATFAGSSEMARVGKLPEWSHFTSERKSELEITANVEAILHRTLEQIISLPVTSVITPNIYISRSFDSREAVIAKNFIRQARSVYQRFGDNRPLFVTLAVCREALLERGDFEEFLNDITMLAEPPEGFYVLIGSRGTEVRTDIFHADVIAGWMLMNHSLSINGFQIINGFSDLLTPFLLAAGGTAGASGWFANLRTFSLDRFQPTQGMARQPILRYLSAALLNRVTFTEKDALSGMVPEVLNGLPHDVDYDPEPDRTSEALQAWEALQRLNNTLGAGDIEENMTGCNLEISRAEALYSEIAGLGFGLDRKSGSDHLEPLREGIHVFKKMTGLD